MDSAHRRKIYDIAVNTFEVTCYMYPLEQSEIEERNFSSPQRDINAIVKFDGAAEGKMIVSPSEELLSEMTKNMMGIKKPDDDQKQGALCEVANIICGNIVPLFAVNNDICYIQPPHISKGLDIGSKTAEMDKEYLQLFLDGGVVEITVYYLLEEKL